MTMRIAISGHRGLPAAVEQQVDRLIRDALAELGDQQVTGLSCIADGADTLFARAVVDMGGDLEVVVPAQMYRDGLPAEHWPAYDSLFSAATLVHEMDFIDSTSEAHQAASERMLELAEELWAVWDGLPARGFGGTADVVAAARSRGLPVRIFWPDGATR
ncbi:hypothetical protein [Planomonospora sp. ID82291]|uniref:hypothetical protein n=1 Tax=Planomonospora sp. ID82291 TaxID=2738136 RepID=UPI0018C3F067|nr:hypothetical protein [Planomonospora sp. ID82291]MBG0818649.1 hypothetical protein [Planomonospora sp. ID82291]